MTADLVIPAILIALIIAISFMSKAKRILGWESTTPFSQLVSEMVAADHEAAKRDAVIKAAGYQTFDYHE
jgi:hypothetical protein